MTDDTPYTWISGISTDGNYLQINTRTYSEDVLFSRSSTDPETRIYKIYDDGTFSHFFDLASGTFCMGAGEIVSYGTTVGFGKVLDLNELIDRANAILDGRTLTTQEKEMYHTGSDS